MRSLDLSPNDPRERMRKRLLNTLLLDERGRSVRFYDDLVKDRKVLIQVMYTACSGICTPATRNLVQARDHLEGLGREMQFISLTLTPQIDTPATLSAYKRSYGIGGGWSFLTGVPQQVETLTRSLGLLGDGDGSDLTDHAGTALVGDERLVKWGHANTLTSPRGIARMIRFELV